MRTRLSDAQIRLVRALLSAGNPKLPYAKIAERVGVSAALIGQIARDEIACYRNVGLDSQDESLDEFLDALGYDDEPHVEHDLGPLVAGEVVRLRSGGPDMTIERVELLPSSKRPVLYATWFTQRGPVTATFSPDTVERV